ncbi:MAG TPA: hypothetical protein VNG71_20210 [Pyrinomonadaceae bacterium]|nr:hypothetical protein [Pyrinomonadaceae bacterium]
MLDPLVRALDDRILSDSTLDKPQFEKLVALQRDLGLVYGDRPTCPFLRPHIISRTQYDTVARAASIIASAVERLVDYALLDDELLGAFGLTARETQMARIDPGYSRLCVSSRLDAYVSGSDFKFFEYNAETPAGVGDQMQLEKVLFGLAHMQEFLRDQIHWRPQPHVRLLSALLDTYREWSGAEERPRIAIVDWRGVSTESEFRILQDYFVAQGFETIIADPRELDFDGERLRAGSLAIDIVYKRVVIHEFLERCDDNHPLARAYEQRRVCIVNSFRTKIAHKKNVFAVLSDSAYEYLFTPVEIEVFHRHIPWTRRVADSQTTFEGSSHDLLDLIRRERDRFVLKPNDDYGGHGVFIGWETSADDWDGAIALALGRPYVVQERVPMTKHSITLFSDRVHAEEVFIDFNPFLFNNEVEGALIRLSSSTLLNVTSGGGQTALLVLEDM